MAKRRAAKAVEKIPPAPLAGADLEETPTELVDLAGIKNHPRNYKLHKDNQLAHLAETIRIAGIYKNIVIAREGTILMGHGVAEAARRAGRKQISARRLDLDPNDPRALKLVAADNEVGNLAERDDAALAGLLRGIVETEGLLGTGLGDEEWGRLIAVVDGAGAGTPGAENTYTKKIQAPIYEQKGQKPKIAELCDLSKTQELLGEIEKAKIPDDVKAFLRLAAQRHAVFDYEQIAEFYAHAPKAVQALFESSALVIIDFKKAIEGGFVVMTQEIAEAYPADAKADDEAA